MKTVKTFEEYHYGKFDMERVLNYYEQGLTTEEIADKMDMSADTIIEIINKLKKTGDL